MNDKPNDRPTETLKLPEPLYSCCFDYCRQEVSYPAEMLFWCEPENGWVCDNCFSNVDGDCEKGISLAGHLAARPATLEQRALDAVERLLFPYHSQQDINEARALLREAGRVG